MLECAMIPGLMVEVAKCGVMTHHCVWVVVMCLLLRLLVSVVLTIVWSMVNTSGGPQCLQEILGSSAVPLGPVSRDQSGRGDDQSQWHTLIYGNLLQVPINGRG